MSAAPVLALCGGVGGAKLALGLQHSLAPGALRLLINTGDDFEHLGLKICPDLDTVMYTLADIVDTTKGWGRADETWNFLGELRRLGAPDWFMLGDKDLAVHVERTRRLRAGESLGAVTKDLAVRLGIASELWPMSDAAVPTLIDTDQGRLEFQRYFVALRAQPTVHAIQYVGAAQTRPAAAALALLADPALAAVIICPSNPWLSIAPLLAMPALRETLADCRAPVVAISPLIGGRAVKGPTAKIMRELGIEPTAAAIADFYADLLDGLIIDTTDAAQAAQVGIPTLVTSTLMQTLADKKRLASEALRFAASLR